MNLVVIIGRLTRDPDVTTTQGTNPTKVARWTVAVPRNFGATEEQKADFIGCVAFGKRAEVIENYFKKGMKIVVRGRLQTGSYENKEKQKVYTTDVVADDIEFGESKASQAASANARAAAGGQAPAQGPVNAATPAQAAGYANYNYSGQQYSAPAQGYSAPAPAPNGYAAGYAAPAPSPAPVQPAQGQSNGFMNIPENTPLPFNQ